MSETLRSELGAEAALLPPFCTFVAEMADNDQRILTDTRLIDPTWEYYDRTGDTVSVMVSQPQYRPWESMPLSVNSKDAILRAGFSSPLDAYQSVTLQPIANKLPSFQSQFQTFPETTVIPETGLPSVTPVPVTSSPTPSASPSQLTQLTQLTTPSSPAHLTTLAQVTPLSTTLTTLSPVNATTFHTLTAVNARSYPIVPAPLQARELTQAGQTFIDDRHIQLYQPNITTINAFPTQNGIIHQNGTLIHQNGSLLQNIQSPTVVHVLKNEPFDVKSLHEKYTPNGLHHSNFQNPMLIDNGYEKKTNGFSPTRSDFRKKERRKMRANSTESDGSSMEVGSESSGQVAAISSTAGFKSPMHGAPQMNTGPMDLDDISNEKQTKKKRKRCGECIGCQRKDNCGDCAPCRNDKSHQICKQRRCEKLTEKKLILAPDGTLQTVKSESRRGRGRGRSAVTPSYRGRKPLGGAACVSGSGGLSPGAAAAPTPSPVQQTPTSAAPSPAPATVPAMKQDPTQPMAPMPFYAGDPNRFSTTWQADPTQGWQNQFIQQLPTQTGQTTLDYQGNAYATSPHYQAGTTYTVQNVAATFDAANNTYYQPTVQAVPNTRPPERSPRAFTFANEQYNETAASVTAAGNDQPGYLPGSDGPRASLDCNGYSGGEYGGHYRERSHDWQHWQHDQNQQQQIQNQQQQQQQQQQQLQNQQQQQIQNQQQQQQLQNQQQQQQLQNQQHQLQNQQQQIQSQQQQMQNQQQQMQSHQTQQQQLQKHQNQQQNQMQNHQNQQMQNQQMQNQMQNHQNQQIQNHQGQQMQNQQRQDEERQMFSASERVNLNSRLKTMILNKQNQRDGPASPPDEPGGGSPRPADERQTGHFLSYSHHLRGDLQRGEQAPPAAGGRVRCPAPAAAAAGGGGPRTWRAPSPFAQPDSKDFHAQLLLAPAHVHERDFRHPAAPLVPKAEAPDDYPYPVDERLLKAGDRARAVNPAASPKPNDLNPYRDYRGPNGTARSPRSVLPPISTIKQENFGHKQMGFQSFQNFPIEGRQDSVDAFAQVPRYHGNVGFQKYNRHFNETQSSEESDNKTSSGKCSPVDTKPPFYIEQIKSEHSPPGHKIYKNVNYNRLPRPEPFLFSGDGGPAVIKNEVGYSCCRQGSTKNPPPEHLRDGACPGYQTKDEIIEGDPDSVDKVDPKNSKPSTPVPETKGTKENQFNYSKEYLDNLEKLKNNSRTEVPDCNCFPADKNPPEPGSYYTHLGAAATLSELRKELESRTGLSGKELRIEKICYTGKEGKTAQGCPMAKWVIRRTNYTEKVLVVVKCRNGHKCSTSWIVVCLVAWEGIPQSEADLDYTLLSHKLNRYGLPTTRRCATNENRTCACQGLDPEMCGASYSFGCSWSMYYNGCKYARSKTVRKFRLSVKTEESEIEERMHVLATLLTPLYMNLAPKAFDNQCQFEKEASDCRLGFKSGRPFSGVTACIDFCAHAHRDLHNMNSGCTAVVTLAKHRALARPKDEQLHVLPLYVLEQTDEFGSADGQRDKVASGALEVLDKYPMEVRVRSVPLQPCRRHGKKRKDEDNSDSANNSSGPGTPQQSPSQKKSPARAGTPQAADPRSNQASPRSQHSASPRAPTPALSQHAFGNAHFSSAFANPQAHNQPGALLNPSLGNPALLDMASMIDNFTEAQLQSNQISSTVLDSPYNPYDQSYNLHHQNSMYNPNHMSPLLEGTAPCPNQIPNYAGGIEKGEHAPYPPANPQHHPAQIGANPNHWPDFAHAELFNSVVKEDPDSTTAHLNNAPNNYSPDSSRTENANLEQMKNIGQLEKPSLLGDLNQKLPDFELPNSPRLTEITEKSKNTPQSPISMQSSETKSPNNATDVMTSPDARKSLWKSPDPKNWDPSKPREQTTPENENALFRVPKSRPPSRSQHTTSETLENSTFLKPYPPTERAHPGQGYECRNPYDNRLNTQIPQTPTSQNNLTINHENQHMALQNKPVQEFSGNGFQPVNQNSYGNQSSIQGYGNYPQIANHYPAFTPSHPYGHFNPYENSYNDYNSLAYYNAEKYKREELLRNSHCYNSYGYQYNPNFPPNFYQNSSPNWCQSSPNWCIYPPPFSIPYPQEPPKAEPIGEVTEFSDNLECFKDSQMGGVAIALGHGSVLFECAKHEMHSTTSVRSPNRMNPTRISLVFYQHRNLNRPKHGLDEWEEKMRLKKLGANPPAASTPAPSPLAASPAPSPAPAAPAAQGAEPFPGGFGSLAALVEATAAAKRRRHVQPRTDTQTTMSWTTLFPMQPCTVTGPYQESAT